jgi:tubulin beta
LREIAHIQAGQSGSQIGTQFWDLLCDEHGIGGDGDYCGNNDAQLGRIIVFYHEASGGNYVLRAVLFGLKSGMIDAVRASPLGELFRPRNLVNQNAGAGSNWAKTHYKRAGRKFS